MKCPKCEMELEKRNVERVELNRCPTCKGHWFDDQELRKVKELAGTDLNWMDFELWKHPDRFVSSPASSLCPRCGKGMVGIDYDNTEIEVDFCTECRGVWLDRWEFEKIIAALREELLTNTQFFRSEDPSGSDAFRLTIYMGSAVFSLSYLISGRVGGFLESVAWTFILVFSSYLIADGTYNVIKLKGKDLGGLLVSGDGIVDRSSWGSFGRVYWPEIKRIYPVKQSFLGLPMGHQLIGLDVTDSYRQRKPTWIRFRTWLNRRVFKAPDLQLSSRRMRDSPERILKVLQDGLREHELRSISEAKELDSGD